MNEFCVLVNITPGRSPEGEFLVSPKRDDETLGCGFGVGCGSRFFATLMFVRRACLLLLPKAD
jgi:hypothetical protein